ncbi:MAG: YceI family protein, partial [Gammaproteobacteria bacterium]|nr:YceI family protein [Gammaproteobacteria bacterium]
AHSGSRSESRESGHAIDTISRTGAAALDPVTSPSESVESVPTAPVTTAQPQATAQATHQSAAAIDPPLWTMSPGQGTLAFIGSYTGAEFRGQFVRFAPRILFAPDNLPAAMIDVEVDVTSATLGSADMDAMLPETEWFDFSRFPSARFRATSFNPRGQGYVANGELSLKGRVQPVSLYLEWQAQGANRARLRARATLNRVAFGIGSGEWAQDQSVGFDVQVEAELLLQRDAIVQ